MSQQRKKLSKTAWVYIFIALFVTVLGFFSVTLAWYIKAKEEYLGITFANPVVVNIDTEIKQINTIDGGNLNALKPGSKLSVNTGIRMDDESSNAYVRAKISLICEELLDENGAPLLWDNYVNITGGSVTEGVTPISSAWQEVVFNENGTEEKWYVCKSVDGIARELTKGDAVSFYEGEIILSGRMDNRFAGKKIKIVFIVESIQTEGVVDPISCGEWGKLK